MKTTKAGGGNFNEGAPATSATELKRREKERERERKVTAKSCLQVKFPLLFARGEDSVKFSFRRGIVAVKGRREKEGERNARFIAELATNSPSLQCTRLTLVMKMHARYYAVIRDLFEIE